MPLFPFLFALPRRPLQFHPLSFVSPQVPFVVSLPVLALGLLTARPAQAQYPGGGYPGGGWSVQDQAGNAISPNQDGSGYPLRGPSTGTYNLTGAYPSVLAAAQKPNPTTGYAFLPNPSDYQGWLFTTGSTPPGGGYDPFHIWINASASNDVGTSSGGVSGYLGNYSTGYQYVNGGINASVGGMLWAVFQWSGANPPDHLDVLLTTRVNASASVGTYISRDGAGNLSSSAIATDSLNETAQVGASASQVGASASQGGPPVVTGGVPLVVGRHLLRLPVDPATGKASASLGGTSTASASNSVLYGVFGNYPGTTYQGYYQQTNGPTGASAVASIGATVTPDSRDLMITSSDIETSYHSGPLNPVTGNYPQDVRAGDGSIVTDSAVSPPLNQPGGATTWTASPTLWAQAAGFQSPTYAWSISGPGTSSAGNSNHTVLSETFPVSTTDKALNKQSTATVKVTDSDGATAANTFTIRWHYPKENAFLFASGQPFWQPDEPQHVTAIGYVDGNATGTFGYSTYVDFLPTASSAIFTVGSNLPASPWSAFVAAVGLTASQVQPTVTTASCNFDQCWNSKFSTGLPSPLDPALRNKYQMNPLLVVQYQEQTWQYDQYGQKGYQGPAQESFNHFTGSVQSAGEFTKISSPPPGG